MTTLDFFNYKQENRKISMVTCYDATFARIVEKSEIDCILIGDSLSMVMHGKKLQFPQKCAGWLNTQKACAAALKNTSFRICRF